MNIRVLAPKPLLICIMTIQDFVLFECLVKRGLREIEFLEKYGPKEQFELETGSPFSGFLNSGLQLYWLKRTKPALFDKIRYSLHFPQYVSYLFTGIPVSDFTSVGCHTGLWDFTRNDYHRWVYDEGIHYKV